MQSQKEVVLILLKRVSRGVIMLSQRLILSFDTGIILRLGFETIFRESP